MRIFTSGIEPDSDYRILYVQKTDMDFGNPNPTCTVYELICKYRDKYAVKNIEKFLNSPLFDDKTFLDIEEDLEIYFC